MATGTLAVSGDADADRVVNEDPLALLIAMLLDQQIPMEWAFMGPHRLQERLGRALDATEIAAMDPAALEAVFKQKPALHRFPTSMAKRTHDLCAHLVEHHDGDAVKVWQDVRSAEELFDRLGALPGYGDEKARIFVAILAKRLGNKPTGWEDVAGPFADTTPRSVADIDSSEALQRVREWKKAQKAKGKSKQE